MIVFTAFIGTKIGPPPMGHPEFAPTGRGRPFVSSLFFRQLLTMSITCLSAVIVETFTLAQQKQKSEALARAELKDSELKFLKMQINPHFLFNSLNNIYALSVTNSEKTQEGINTLSLMLRYVLYDCQGPKIPLRKELQYLMHFIELFKLKSSAEYNIKVEDEVEDDSLMIAPMLFVPFIENAFKHSGIEKRGDSFIRVKLITKGNMVEFSVENSLPTKPLITDAHGGIGLQNVEKRLKILYPETHNLNITKTNTFYINLKINH
jgi:two-component system LytT family sensor kinase